MRSYDVTTDDHFLLIEKRSLEENGEHGEGAEQEAEDALIEVLMPDRIQLVQNWFTELEEKVPSGQ